MTLVALFIVGLRDAFLSKSVRRHHSLPLPSLLIVLPTLYAVSIVLQADTPIVHITTVTLLFFVVEMSMMSFAIKGYLLSFFFWLDLAG